MKKPSKVNTRNIRPRAAQVSTVQGGKEMRKRRFQFFQKDRSGEIRDTRTRGQAKKKWSQEQNDEIAVL